MKSYIKTGILLLWILGGLNTFSQKKILTPDSYQEWKRIDNPDLSPDGKWVIYNLVSKEQSELYLYETATQQTWGRNSLLLAGRKRIVLSNPGFDYFIGSSKPEETKVD